MKAFKIYLTSILCLLGFMACSSDDDTPMLSHVESSIIDNLPAQSYILSEPAEGDNPLLFTVTWSETMFYLDGSSTPTPAAPITYSLEMDRKGNNFESPVVIAGTGGLSANVFMKDFNLQLLTDLKANPNEVVDIEFRIIANYGQNLAGIAVSGNTIPLSVTPFLARKEMQPIYIVGDMNGWDNTNTNFIMFRNSNDPKDEEYTYTGRFAANTYFKLIPDEALGTDKMYCSNGDGTLTYEERADGSFYNETEGYKTLTINLADMTYTIENYNASSAPTYTTMGPIGGFCNWDNEPPMTVSAYDPHQWSITYTFEISTACKFRGDKDWANNWGGDASDIPYGKGVFDGAGTDVSTPGTYKIYFNDLTHHFVILSQK